MENLQQIINAKNSAILEIQDWECRSDYIQNRLRDYITCEKFPLAERFEVWKKYCKKKELSSILCKGDFICLGDMVRSNFCPDCDIVVRGQKIDWDYFLTAVSDAFDDGCEIVKKYVSSVNEFKEILIKTNFGSFIYDW